MYTFYCIDWAMAIYSDKHVTLRTNYLYTKNLTQTRDAQF